MIICYLQIQSNELNRNIITGGTRSITANTTGAWYRLGYVQGIHTMFGEFVVYHSWGTNLPTILKIIVSCVSYNYAPCTMECVSHSAPDVSGNPTANKSTLVPKGRVVFNPDNATGNIYIDIFIKSDGKWNQGSNIWAYKLSKALAPMSYTWKDSAFANASIPTNYIAKEFSFI